MNSGTNAQNNNLRGLVLHFVRDVFVGSILFLMLFTLIAGIDVIIYTAKHFLEKQVSDFCYFLMYSVKYTSAVFDVVMYLNFIAKSGYDFVKGVWQGEKQS